MALLSESITNVFGLEGVYSDDKDDKGGETVFGISRKNWPNLELWEIVDDIKKNVAADKFKAQLSYNPKIKNLVVEFYKKEFWDKFCLDIFSQRLSDEIFEQSINLGVTKCTKNIQTALNILNRNATLWVDLVADGNFGHKTLSALRDAISGGDEKYVFGCLNLLQGAHYLSLNNEKYIRGWIKRAQWNY